MVRLAIVCAATLAALGCAGGDDGPDAVGELVLSSGIQLERSDGVYVVDLESGEERRIGPVAQYGGSWSPTGTKAAIASGTMVVTTIATGARERFDAPRCSLPVWSPDETTLACEWGEPWIVSTLDLATEELRTLTDPSEVSVEPAWSPDSRSIAYVTHGAVVVMRRDGSGKRRVANAGDPAPGHGPAWSPDGRSIAYLDGTNVWVVSPAGRDRRMLLEGDGPSRGLAWSPDGRYIAVTHGDGDFDFEIFVIEVAGGEVRNVTDNEGVHDQWPVWSPDSRHVAYLADDGNSTSVMVLPVEGGASSTVSETLATILHWLPEPG